MGIFDKLYNSPVWQGEVFYEEYAHNSGRINTKNKAGIPHYLLNEEREKVVEHENSLCRRLIGDNSYFKLEYPKCGYPLLAECLGIMALTFDVHRMCVLHTMSPRPAWAPPEDEIEEKK